jgi:hypothetical protein
MLFVLYDSWQTPEDYEVRTVTATRISMQQADTMADHYREMTADERLRDFFLIQKTYLAAMGYKTYPKIERTITFRKMK